MNHMNCNEQPQGAELSAGSASEGHRPWTEAPVIRYSVAVIAVAIAGAVRSALDPDLREIQPFVLFLVPVLFMGWLAGPGPAIFAAVLGWLIGDWFFFAPRYTLLGGGDREIIASIVYVAIATALIFVTHRLRRARSEIETTLHSITDAFLSLDRQWRFTYANPEAQRLLRKPASQLLGRNAWDIFPNAGPFRQRYEAALASGQAAHFEQFYGHLQTWFDVHAYPGPAGLSVYFRDITKRKQMEEALRQSEQTFRAIVEQAAIGIGRVNLTDARWLDVNETFCRSLGYTPEFMRATPWPEITHPDDVEFDLVPFRRLAAGELDIYSVEKRFIHRDGHPVWSRLNLSLVRDAQGRPDYEIAIIENIDARKRLEAELQRHAANLEQMVSERTAKLRETIAELEGFSYSLVHDMRAPLRAMLSFAGILESEAGQRLAPEHADLLRKISLAAKRMDQLVTGSLNYSKILHQDLPLQPVNLGALLRGMVETYPDLHEAHVHVAIDLGDLRVHGNESALTQIFSNLLSNAVKFVAPGVHPRIRIWAEPSTSGSGAQRRPDSSGNSQLSTLIYIQDNGIGIPKEQQDRIFGLFQRLHRAEEYPGTGVGLALVKKSLERIGGLITLESEPGIGTRFCVELPLAAPLAEPLSRRAPPDA